MSDEHLRLLRKAAQDDPSQLPIYTRALEHALGLGDKEVTELDLFLSWCAREGLTTEDRTDEDNYQDGVYRHGDVVTYSSYGTGGVGDVVFRRDGTFLRVQGGYY